MATSGDLDWWLKTAATVDWTWAETYSETAPHHYVVAGRTRGLDDANSVRAARVIHTFGQPGKYYGITNIYLEDEARGVKWWTMDSDVRDTNLINQATTDRLYGVQNAPPTLSGIATAYDGIATSYDVDSPLQVNIADRILDAVREARGVYPPSVLDVASGTGRMLDLRLTSADRYAGLDPSTPMLNQLVRKHPSVARLYPTTIEQALEDRVFTPRQFDVVTMVVGSEDTFADDTIAAVQDLASRVFIHVIGDEIRSHRI